VAAAHRARAHDDLDDGLAAHATARYLLVSGDTAVLKEQLPFIEGLPLGEGEHDAFFAPEISKKGATLYDHCARARPAIKRSSSAGHRSSAATGTTA
jgi:cellobiose phosphorylase